MTVTPGPTRLMLVDDTADLRALLRLTFEASGRYQVVAEAGDGLEALEQLDALGSALDLILLDLSMPRMDGLEVLPHLRGRLPDVPVVVLSGFAASSTAQAALSAGAALYLEKGLRPADLVAAIEEADLGATGSAAPAARPVAGVASAERIEDTDEVVVAALGSGPSTHEVVAELAHDVRSPLLVAREVVRVLRRSVTDDELLHLADRAMAAVDRVDLTLESAIEHARLGQAPLQLRPWELRGLLVELSAGLEEKAARRLRFRGPAVRARVDRGAFTRAAGNVIENALRYSDGRVEIETSRNDDGTVCVCVRDHGPGLGETPEALFALFARGTAGRDRRGSGLGLATARRLTERMHGRLDGADAEGGGARFRLVLPGA